MNALRADKIKVGKKEERKGLCYTHRQVVEKFTILDPREGDVDVLLEVEGGRKESLKAWVIDKSIYMDDTVEAMLLLLEAQGSTRRGDGTGRMAGVGEHCR